MSMIPKETTTTETPATEGAPTPKDPAAAASPPATSGAPSPQAGTAASPSDGGAPGTSAGAPSTPDPKATEYEKKLSALADFEFGLKKQKDDVEARLGRVAALEKIADVMPEGVTGELLAEALGKLKAGEEAAFLKLLLREKWGADALIRWADAFDAEELPVEERVRRELAAEKKREQDAKDAEARKLAEAQEAAKKKADEDAIADATRQLDESTKSAGKWLVANVEKYPLIAALDDDEDVNHEQMYRSRLIDYVEKNGNRIPADEEGLQAMRTHIFDSIEAVHRRKLERMNPKPKDMRQEMSEWDRVELLRLKGEERAAAAPVVPLKTGPKTGLEEALARMEQQDREDREREALSYGRR